MNFLNDILMLSFCLTVISCVSPGNRSCTNAETVSYMTVVGIQSETLEICTSPLERCLVRRHHGALLNRTEELGCTPLNNVPTGSK